MKTKECASLAAHQLSSAVPQGISESFGFRVQKLVVELARDMGLTETSVRRWVAQADIDAGPRDGTTTADRQEIARLNKQVRILTEERDILKRATAVFFAKETR